MKQNRRLIAIVMVALLAVATVFALAACTNGAPLSGKATLVVADGDSTKAYEVDLAKAEMTTNNSVFDLIEYVAKTEQLEYSGTMSGSSYEDASGNKVFSYGAYINSIGTLNPDAANNEYIAFFMSDESLKDVSAYALANKDYNGTTVYYSGYGVSGVKLHDGLVAYFTIASY